MLQNATRRTRVRRPALRALVTVSVLTVTGVFTAPAATAGGRAYAAKVTEQVAAERVAARVPAVAGTACASDLARQRAARAPALPLGAIRVRRPVAACDGWVAIGVASATTAGPRNLVRRWAAHARARGVMTHSGAVSLAVAVARRRGGGMHVELVVLRRMTSGEFVAALLAETNRRRTAHGLAALTATTCATGLAQDHSAAMAARDELSHSSLETLRKECRSRGAAENVAVSRSSIGDPASVVEMWMGSAVHRANILDPEATRFGAGAGYTSAGGAWYLTLDLLTR